MTTSDRWQYNAELTILHSEKGLGIIERNSDHHFAYWHQSKYLTT